MSPLTCRGCGDTDGPFTPEGLCETCDAWPPRGGHDNLCAYAAGISTTCTCAPATEDGAQ